MIITKRVKFRDGYKNVSDLSVNSTKKVEVRCPECGEVREVIYRSLCNAGHHICLPCMRVISQGKKLKLGKRYGRLVVVDNTPSKSLVRCDCGSEVYVDNYNLSSNKTRSCGCLRVENMKRVGVYPEGKNHWNWKGGIVRERERFMQSKDYKTWRKEVFERDDHTCQVCGQVGYELNAHHLDSYAEHPESRTDINNGVTLCEGCHNSFHSVYGYGCTKEDYNEFTKEVSRT